ncbi:helix-turn-helix domain-containing protein [Phyllobacterium lublinensis]|uniref:helix-turn-helix domain-containing protein n=1 Tax=Phyllobacterium lublinensis TaxID=2875708 RepID=UPI001CD0132D|nr:helix-turn-helix domain-containing protein [Phyllobacterium sp. 2063]MBZ9654682.1 helix-turn-helix domain-containing protein [Phyllobacterium sp. 2063]
MNKLAVTIPEAVQISGIGRTVLYSIFKSGGLKPRKSGKRTLVLVDELEAYLKSLPVGTSHD